MPTDVPIGTMLPYAGNKIPAGWLACDNAAYPTTTYPQLYAAIGFTYGMDGSNYRVPDTRGVFMRGMDATATRDANRPAGSIQLSGTVPDASSIFTGASSSATGGVGYVPAPLAGQQNHVLTGGGGWQQSSTITYTNARIDGLGAGPSLKFTALSTSPTCPAPFVLTNPTTFTSPNISGNYKIDILINNFATFTKAYGIITPVIGGVPSRTTITGSQIDNVPGGLSGMVILPIPANTALTFSLSNVSYTYSGGTITIVSL
jgi:microcystin-dependent protein